MQKELLEKIKTLREEKDKEVEVFELIEEAKSLSEKEKDWKSLVTLFWEESLTAQHLVMNEKAKAAPNVEIMTQFTAKMASSAENAKKVIQEHDLKDMLAVACRFMGRVYDYQENFEHAKQEYEQALEYIKDQEDKKSSLEIRGFLASTLIMLGKQHEGIELAKKVFDDFINSDIGKKLKSEDYVTWAIWLTGVFPRIINALHATGEEFNTEELKDLLAKSEHYITNPEGEITWGGPDPFKYRKDEYSKIKQLVVQLALVFSAFHTKSHF